MINISIPLLNPNDALFAALDKLATQTVSAIRVTLVDSGSTNLNTKRIVQYNAPLFEVNIMYIKNDTFDHGGTRNLAACQNKADILIFMTQDAIPKNNTFIEELITPFSDPDVAAVYGRQVANEDAKDIERFTREFNYPNEGTTKTKDEMDRLGIKTFFLTNVCAAYRSADFFAFGGFPNKTICNEDMILASKFILGGKKIVYNPKAEVYHSHNYTYRQQFRRNFDIGVSLKENVEILQYARSEKEGFKFIKSAVAYCFKIKKPYLILVLFFESVFKLLGYKLGINYKKIPPKLRQTFSLNRGYWK